MHSLTQGQYLFCKVSHIFCLCQEMVWDTERIPFYSLYGSYFEPLNNCDIYWIKGLNHFSKTFLPFIITINNMSWYMFSLFISQICFKYVLKHIKVSFQYVQPYIQNTKIAEFTKWKSSKSIFNFIVLDCLNICLFFFNFLLSSLS